MQGQGKASWRLLAVAIIAATTMAASGVGAEVRAIQKLEVIDAKKKLVGEGHRGGTFSDDGRVHVNFHETEHTKGTFVLRFDRWTIKGDDSLLMFSEPDCKGEYAFDLGPWGQQDWIYHIAVVAPPGHTVYIMDRNAPLKRFMPLSLYDSLTEKCYVAHDWDTVTDLVPAIPVMQLDDHFTPPFHIGPR